MTLILPASLQELVSHQLLRVAVSHDASRFLFDIPAARDNSRRTRYSYRLTNGAVVGSRNIGNLLGRVVLAVYLVIPESGPAKIVFETNPTTSQLERCIIYIDTIAGAMAGLSLLLQEDGFNIQQEDLFNILLEDGPLSVEDIELEDFDVGKNLFNPKESETRFFIVHEDEF